MADTLIERLAGARARDLRRDTGQLLVDAREVRELSLRAVASAAGVDRALLAKAEHGEATLTTDALAAVAAVLGMEASLRLYQTVGPRLRDHVQARMINTLLSALHKGWQPRLEVPVWQPVRGVIDLVLVNSDDPTVVVCESHGELRSAEQQLRHAAEKADSIASATGWPWTDEPSRICRLLLLRDCAAMRELVQSLPDLFAAAYPGTTRLAVDALVRGTARLPDATILWVDVRGEGTRLLAGPARAIAVGR
jgi:transcriptional regulator with XRE-family HTH domain